MAFSVLESQKQFVKICLVTWEREGGSGKPVTNSDMGVGGLKIAVFTVTSFLNDPYKQYCEMNAPLGKNGLI